MSHTGSVNPKLCEEYFCNYPTYKPDVYLFLIPLPPQCGRDLPAWLIGEGPAICSLCAYGKWTNAHFGQQAQCYFTRSRLLSPDKQRRVEDRRKQSSVQPISCHAGVNNDNTTRLSSLIKAYQQLDSKILDKPWH